MEFVFKINLAVLVKIIL